VGTTLRAWIVRKGREADNQILATTLSIAGNVAAAAVAETAQTAVSHLKAAREDGKLTREEAQAAFRTALNRAWSMLGRELQETLTHHAGSESAAKDKVLGPIVEQMVAQTSATASPPVDDAQAASEVTLARARLGLQ
jgi:hypothetical protein